jgi:hypothetical protein
MLFDMIKEVEQKASVTPPLPEPRRLDALHKEVVQNFVDRYDGKSWPRWPQGISRRRALKLTSVVSGYPGDDCRRDRERRRLIKVCDATKPCARKGGSPKQ